MQTIIIYSNSIVVYFANLKYFFKSYANNWNYTIGLLLSCAFDMVIMLSGAFDMVLMLFGVFDMVILGRSVIPMP